MKLRKTLALLLALFLLIALPACGSKNSTDKISVNVGMLKGPTGIGSVYLMDEAENGSTANGYKFTMATAPDELTSALVSGELDISALPTNVAASLYNKTNGGIKILALNTLGVLYILENGGSIRSFEDLRGRTLYATGQGANPQYVLEYLLRQNGLDPETDLTIEYMASDEIVARMASGDIELCMLPVPNATAVLMKNGDVRNALDLTAEWDSLQNGSMLTMGCVVARTGFIEENPEAVDIFLQEYYNSIKMVSERPEGVYELIASYELVGSAGAAEAALPDCNLRFIGGSAIRTAIDGYYQVLFDADNTAIGGAIPDEEFYYTAYSGDFDPEDTAWGY